MAKCIHYDHQKHPANVDVLIEYFKAKSKAVPWNWKDAMAWWKDYDVYA